MIQHAQLIEVAASDSDKNTEIVVEKKSESKEYDDFVEELPPNEPRYASVRKAVCVLWTLIDIPAMTAFTISSTKRVMRASGTSFASSHGQ